MRDWKLKGRDLKVLVQFPKLMLNHNGTKVENFFGRPGRCKRYVGIVVNNKEVISILNLNPKSRHYDTVERDVKLQNKRSKGSVL